MQRTGMVEDSGRRPGAGRRPTGRGRGFPSLGMGSHAVFESDRWRRWAPLALAALLVACGGSDADAAPPIEASTDRPAIAKETAVKSDPTPAATPSIGGRLAVEHREGESFRPYAPTQPVPIPVAPGDRLHVVLDVSGAAHVHAIGAAQQKTWHKLGAWPAEAFADGRPKQWVLDAAHAEITTIFFVASSAALPWAEGLTTADCSALVGQMPKDEPESACDHLYGLTWKVPGRARGRVPPKVQAIDTAEGTRLMGVVAGPNKGAPYTAIEWAVRPRR